MPRNPKQKLQDMLVACTAGFLNAAAGETDKALTLLLTTRVCLADCDWALLGSLQAALGSWHAGHGPNTGQIIGCAANVSQLSAELCHLQIECRHQM